MEVSSPPVAGSRPKPEEDFERCEQCASALAEDQRYCVECGAHRRYVNDPAARYMRSRRTPVRGTVSGGTAGMLRHPPSLALAVLMVAVPLAVAIGVLVGRSSTSGDAKLIAALRAQRPQIVTTGAPAGAGTVTGATTTPVLSSALSSTFPLHSGWTVELQTLPGNGTTQSAADAAERAARAKGASDVGLISQSDFRVTPGPPGRAYVIYAGAYHSETAASKALAKLTARFPQAKVIRVQAAGATSATTSGKVLATSVYGSAHQITGTKVTASQLATGRQVVQHIQQAQGKSYVNAQRGLPDQISIP